MAADVTEVHPAVTVPGAVAPENPARSQPHRFRFVLLYGALGALVAAAIVGIVLLADRSTTSKSNQTTDATQLWSTWSPTVSGVTPARQIANHVASSYRLDGHQLVSVVAKPPSVPTTTGDVPISEVGVPVSQGIRGDVLTADNSLMFELCGTGQRCAISFGAPSVQRGLLVRREALELSLYTFKYMSGIDSVLTLIPAAPADTTNHFAIYFTRSDLATQLQRPLTQTIDSHSLPQRGTLVDDFVRSHTYEYSFQQALEGDVVVFLSAF